VAFHRDRLLRRALHERFVVTLTGGDHMVSGLLTDVDSRVIRLADVRLVGADGELPADGVLYVERDRVAYMQAVAGP
jgi:hypothetical protein